MKKYFLMFLSVLVLFGFSGCASISNIDKKVGDLENRVQTLEGQQAKLEQGLSEQRETQKDLQGLVDSLKQKEVTKIAVVSPTTKQVQSALKKAGYYTGNIDGVAGDNTKEAITKFQKENNLAADGVIGKNTWAVLSQYYSGEEAESKQ